MAFDFEKIRDAAKTSNALPFIFEVEKDDSIV